MRPLAKKKPETKPEPMKTFWMVVVFGQPDKRHATKAEADQEAQRLACKENACAYVMKAQTCFKPATIREDLK